MKHFLIQSSILSLAFLIAGCIIYIRILPQYYHPVLLSIIPLFYLVTNILHYALLKTTKDHIDKFTRNYMGFNFLKIIVYVIFAFIIVVIIPSQIKTFLVNYIIVYLAFSILEVKEIYQIVKRKR